MKLSICVSFLFLLAVISLSESRIGRSSSDSPHWSIDAFPSPLFKQQKNLIVRKPNRRATFDRSSFGSSGSRIPLDSIFDRPNFRSRFQSRPLSSYDSRPSRVHHVSANNIRRQDSGSSFHQDPQEAANAYPQEILSGTSPKQRYLMTLAAKLYRHKQAQNEYSNQLLNSFGSNVAPFSKK